MIKMPTEPYLLLTTGYPGTREILLKTGVHYVIDSLVDIEPVITDINARLARGEKP